MSAVTRRRSAARPRRTGRRWSATCPPGFPSVHGAIAAAMAMAEAGRRRHRDRPAVLRPADGRPGHPGGRAPGAGRRDPGRRRAAHRARRWPATGVPVLVMTYWNPVDHYGVRRVRAGPGRRRGQRADHPGPDARRRPGPGWRRPPSTGSTRSSWSRRARRGERIKLITVGLRRLRVRGVADGHHRHPRRGGRPRGRAGPPGPRVHQPAGGRRARRPGPVPGRARWPASPTGSSSDPRSSAGCSTPRTRPAGSPRCATWPPTWPPASAPARAARRGTPGTARPDG